MRTVNLILSTRPLLLRRLLLILFAGPILILTALCRALGATQISVQRLCWCFDSAWANQDVAPLNSTLG